MPLEATLDLLDRALAALIEESGAGVYQTDVEEAAAAVGRARCVRDGKAAGLRVEPFTVQGSGFGLVSFGEDARGEKMFSLLAEFDVPPLDEHLNPPFDVDGHSHFPIFLADNADFGPPSAKLGGSYEYQITMIDRSGNGWRIEAHFAVAP